MTLSRTALISAVSLAAVLGAQTAVAAGTTSTGRDSGRTTAHAVPHDSLRALASRVGLRVGTAVNPYDLATPDYRQITAQQFSTVTPENEMKWQLVEPTRGTYDWAGGDRLVQFAAGPRAAGPRAHARLAQPAPDWLTDGRLRHDQRPSCVTCCTSTSPTRSPTSRARSGSGTSRTSSSRTRGTGTRSQMASTATTSGSSTSARASSPTRSGGRTPADPKALLFYNDFNIAGRGRHERQGRRGLRVGEAAARRRCPDRRDRRSGPPRHAVRLPDQMRADLQRYADLGLKVALTEVDVRTFVNNATQPQPTDPLGPFAHAYYYDQMMQACLAVKRCISFTVWGFGDANSWVPGFFTGEGYAGIYDVNLAAEAGVLRPAAGPDLPRRTAPHRDGWGPPTLIGWWTLRTE